MKFYPIYEQNNSETVAEFARSQPSCRLITTAGTGELHYGIFNHFHDGKCFFLHLNRSDEQLADLKANPKVLLVLEDFLSVIPSYWVDESYAGAATAYYRYAEFDCLIEVSDTRESLMEVLQKMMDHYQPEKNYVPLDPESALYKSSFDTLAIVRLRDRGTPNDLRTAHEVELSIEGEHK